MGETKQTMAAEDLGITHVEEAPVSHPVSKYADRVDDETARYAEGDPIHVDEATNKRLFWKINKRILPVMLLTYFCQSMDKGTLNFSSIMGIKKDAHLVGQEVGDQAAGENCER